MSFTIEYYGVGQEIRVYDGKGAEKTELLLGCPSSPMDGAVRVVPKAPGMRAVADRLVDAFADTPPLAIDVTPMRPGRAEFALSTFAERAADFYKAGERTVMLDDERAREWGYRGPGESFGRPDAPPPSVAR